MAIFYAKIIVNKHLTVYIILLFHHPQCAAQVLRLVVVVVVVVIAHILCVISLTLFHSIVEREFSQRSLLILEAQDLIDKIKYGYYSTSYGKCFENSI